MVGSSWNRADTRGEAPTLSPLDMTTEFFVRRFFR
jgi:hypothetical protein